MSEEGLKIKIGAEVAPAVKGINDVEKSLNKLKGTAPSAGFALQNLGRVAQDLPYGFIGIQNNLNPLLESFQRLKAESGSTGKALKSLAGSLIGAGGLGLALSLASAAFLIYQNGIAGFNKKTKEAKEQVDDYAKSVKEATHQVAEEGARVGVLIAYIKDENTTRRDRVAAVKELQRISPEYFASLDAEKASIGQLTIAYSNYNSGLRRVIEAKILTDQLIKVTEERLKLDEKLNRKGQEEILIGGKLVKVRNFYLDQEGQLNTDSQRRVTLLKTELDLQERIAGLTRPTNLQVNNPKPPAGVKVGAVEIPIRPAVVISNAEREKLARQLNPVPKEALGNVRGLTEGYKALTDVLTQAGIQAGIFSKQNILDEEQLNRVQAYADIIGQSLNPAFQSFFEILLSGSGSPIKALTNALKSIISQMIATIAAAAALALIMNIIFPGSGTFSANFIKFLGPKTGLGQIFSGGKGVANTGSGSLVGAANSGSRGGTLQAVVKGQDLVMILRRSNADLGRNG